MERFQLTGKSGRFNRCAPVMHIMKQVDIVSENLPGFFEDRWDEIKILWRIGKFLQRQSRVCGLICHVIFRHAISMFNSGDCTLNSYCPESLCNFFASSINSIFESLPVGMTVDKELFPAFSSDHIIQRSTEYLCLDIP